MNRIRNAVYLLPVRNSFSEKFRWLANLHFCTHFICRENLKVKPIILSWICSDLTRGNKFNRGKCINNVNHRDLYSWRHANQRFVILEFVWIDFLKSLHVDISDLKHLKMGVKLLQYGDYADIRKDPSPPPPSHAYINLSVVFGTEFSTTILGVRVWCLRSEYEFKTIKSYRVLWNAQPLVKHNCFFLWCILPIACADVSFNIVWVFPAEFIVIHSEC